MLSDSESAPLYGWPLLRLGFRPFYLGAAAFALVAIPLWVSSVLGFLSLQPALPPLLWHAHEMLFGFAAAVVVGFLLTAGKLWTGLATPRGPLLGLLATLWLLARIAAIWASPPLYAFIDASFLVVVATIFMRLIASSRNWRNLPLAGLLTGLAAVNISFHLSANSSIAFAPLTTLHAGLGLIVLVECIIAGRVIPAFTRSATPGLIVTEHKALEIAVLSVSFVAIGVWVLGAPGIPGALLCATAAALHLARQWGWQPGATLKRPILWVLHASYAWIAIGFALLALAQLGWLSPTSGIHALAVGATSGLIVAMITRTARGHTGRPIQASQAETAAYGLMMLAAILRVFGPILAPQWYASALICSALAWSAAFAIYLVKFTPWLISTRLDGKDG